MPSSEALGEAVLWDYRFTLLLFGDTVFEVTFNDERSVSYSMTFHEADGVAHVDVTASEGTLPVVSSDDVAELWKRVTVTIPRLNVLHVQSARATVQGVSFPEPLRPFLEQSQTIALGGGEQASISAHVTSLLQMLLGNSPFASQPLAIECRYGYAIGGLPIEAPVVLVARQDVAIGFAEELVGMVESSIQQWMAAVQPPSTEARLIFTLNFWNALARTDAPLLRLTRVVLPMTAVAS
jgi:hypothetical protein